MKIYGKMMGLGLAVFVAWQPGLCAAVSPAEVDSLIQTASTYEIGQPRDAFVRLDQIIRESKAGDPVRRQMEAAIARAVVADATTQPARHFLCRQLWLIGTEASLPALEKLLNRPDATLNACYALLQYPSPKADAILRDALTTAQGTNLAGVIGTLGDRRDGAAVSALQGLAQQRDALISSTALAALGRIATPDAADALKMLRETYDERMRMDASLAMLQCAQRLAAEGKAKPARELYQNLFAKPDVPRIKRAALIGLTSLGNTEAVDIIVSALNSDDSVLRAAAIAQIPGLKSKGVSERFVKELPQAAPEAQALLIAALAARGEAMVRAAITPFAKAPQPEVALAALQALGRVGNDSSVEVLVGALGGSSPEQAAVAAGSLAQIKDKAASAAVIKLLKSASPEVRVQLIQVLVGRQAVEAVPALIEQAADADAKVTVAAFRALGQLAEPANLDPVIQKLVACASSSASEEAERAVINIARKEAAVEKQSIPVLKSYRQVADTAGRAALLRVLSETGGGEALNAILEAAKSPDAEVKNTGIRALANWQDPSALPVIMGQLKAASSPTHQVLLLRGYLRLLAMPSTRPAAETLAAYQEALSLTRRPEEKKLALAGLGSSGIDGALRMIVPMLDDSAVQTEAALAVAAFFKQNMDPDRKYAIAALQKAIPLIPDPRTKRDTQQVLAKLKQP